MASGSTAMLRRACTTTPLSTLGVHVRPARSTLSNALNFCRSATRSKRWAGGFGRGISKSEKSSSDARSFRRPHGRGVSTSLREASIKLLPAAAQHRARSKSGKPNGVSGAVTNSWVFLTAPWRREADRAGRLLPSHRWAAPMHQRAAQAASRPPSPAACPAVPPRACQPSLAYRDR